MKILILANSSDGLYDFRNELLSGLMKEGHEITASTPFGLKAGNLSEMGVKLIETSVDRRGINPLKDLKLLMEYKRIIKEYKPELVISYTIKPDIYGGIVCRMKHLKYAINITGLGTAFQKKGLLKWLVIRLYKMGCKKAKVIFFENEENKNIFIENKIAKEEKTCVLPGAGVNTQKYSLMEFHKNEGTNFLFMGRIMKEKGVDELFEATRKLWNEDHSICLHVLGTYEEEYKETVEKYEKEGWLQYHGYQKDVRPFIEKADCFVLPSWHEGMANTNLECASSGRPVITTRIHGCLEAVKDGITGYLVEKENPSDLYEKMKMLNSIPHNQRIKMGRKGREWMLEHFDKSKVVKMTIERLMDK